MPKTLTIKIKDEGLIKRIKQGINDAKARKGRFVDEEMKVVSMIAASHRKSAYR